MQKNSGRYRLFVSYSRKDSALVSALVRLLVVADDRVFQDVRDIDPGSRWRAVITMAVESCDKMLVFWCAHSSRSLEVEREYVGALRHRKVLVPVLLDDTDLPKPLNEYQAIDLRGALGPHRAGSPPAASGARAINAGDECHGDGDLGGGELSVQALHSAAARLRADLVASFGPPAVSP